MMPSIGLQQLSGYKQIARVLRKRTHAVVPFKGDASFRDTNHLIRYCINFNIKIPFKMKSMGLFQGVEAFPYSYQRGNQCSKK
jgi:hypothetical protein